MYRSFFIYFLYISLVFPQTIDNYFIEGNNYFNNKDFKKAIESYSKIIKKGFFSEDLYLNLGNAYFEIEDYGNARWSYEMGLKLNPLNDGLKNNNNVNKTYITNYIEVPKNSLIEKINVFYQSLSINQFILINSIIVLITSILFFLFKVFELRLFKRLYIYLASLSCIFLLISLTKNFWDYNNKFGIIIENESILFSAPFKNESIEVSIFYSGNKVKVLQSTDLWLEISSLDGRKGWIRAQDIRNLK